MKKQHDHSQLDQLARQQALDITKSFIVQAPAGSGKTELLTQRYLNLLAHTEQAPEEIIAITFTRKAAGEMRERILSALNNAKQTPPPKNSHQLKTWQLAKKVLHIDQKKEWHIETNPNRLRILTIDALSVMLCSHFPLLSGFGAKPKINEQSELFYQLAVERLLDPNNLNNHEKKALKLILLHLDNDIDYCQRLLINMLAKRDQWLPHIFKHWENPTNLRKELEHSLNNLIFDSIKTANKSFEASLLHELLDIGMYAANNLKEIDANNSICYFLQARHFPQNDINDIKIWQAIANLLLTKDKQWRKRFSKTEGFPAIASQKNRADKEQVQYYKKRIATICANLSSNSSLLAVLTEITQLPPATYNQNQWNMIAALAQLLPLLTAQLQVIFRENAVIDYTELSLGALRALGDADNPSDLALHLDYRIRHLLIDEFQDTSIMQYELIEALTRGWEMADGKTLFIVGDPMQSIYRFRNAEVGLFLRAQQQTIGHIQLIPLTLYLNFRSQPALINWVNQTFSYVFPQQADISAGAVPFSQAVAATQSNEENAVHHYLLCDAQAKGEAEKIIEIIKQHQTQTPDASIAILVRSRTQLIDIIELLQQNQINYEAVEIESLASRIEIIDLVSLTQALLNLSNRIAWLSILRAPWCGLTLADLLIISKDKPIIWHGLTQYQQLSTLSKDARTRLQRVFPILQSAIHSQQQLPLSQWVKGVWQALGGPACLDSLNEISNCETYFKLLEEIENNFSLELMQQKLQKLFADNSKHDQSQLQIMTIHKSKGLEFDHVILPGLHRKQQNNANELLMWLERPAHGSDDLILAPIKAPSEARDQIADYVKNITGKKLNFESARLLYVAITRAKKSLHLLAETTKDEDNEIKSPLQGSLLNLIWDTSHNEWLQSVIEQENSLTMSNDTVLRNDLSRLSNDWKNPLSFKSTDINIRQNKITIADLKINLNQEFAQQVGRVIHKALHHLSLINQKQQKEFLLQQEALCSQWLLNENIAKKLIPQAMTKVKTAIEKTLHDPRGQWILGSHHEAHSEYALSAFINNQPMQAVIDRSFIDENNTRWIIDYKTSEPQNKNINDFLAEQKNIYQSQLNNYAAIFNQLENSLIYCALYFPLCSQWLQWPYQEVTLNQQPQLANKKINTLF